MGVGDDVRHRRTANPPGDLPPAFPAPVRSQDEDSLVARLRPVASTVRSFTPSGAAVLEEAADTIERLGKQLAKARDQWDEARRRLNEFRPVGNNGDWVAVRTEALAYVLDR